MQSAYIGNSATVSGTTQKSAVGGYDGSRKPHPNKLVWEQINCWIWTTTCGRFKIERFVVGEHEWLGTGFAWPERFRILKHTPEWYGDLGSEPSLDAAQRACEGLIRSE